MLSSNLYNAAATVEGTVKLFGKMSVNLRSLYIGTDQGMHFNYKAGQLNSQNM